MFEFNVALCPRRPWGLLGTTSIFTQLLGSHIPSVQNVLCRTFEMCKCSLKYLWGHRRPQATVSLHKNGNGKSGIGKSVCTWWQLFMNTGNQLRFLPLSLSLFCLLLYKPVTERHTGGTCAQVRSVVFFLSSHAPVSYTHLTLPTNHRV